MHIVSSVPVTVLLHEAGRFTWPQWVDVFAKHIKVHPQQPGEAERTAYYRQWLSALEELLDELSLTGVDERWAYKEDWRRSYFATEHGDAVEFQKNLPDTHDHEHDHSHSHSHSLKQPGPIFVSPSSSGTVEGSRL